LYANGLQSHALTDPALRHRLDESLITYPQNILVTTLTPLLDRLMLSPLPGGSEPENANASSHRRDGFIGRPNIAIVTRWVAGQKQRRLTLSRKPLI
jgi:hypothetical protein